MLSTFHKSETLADAPAILLISSVQPKPTTAGEIILYRHLSQLENWRVLIATHTRDKTDFNLPRRSIERLRSTRFHSWVNDLDALRAGHDWNPQVCTIQDLKQVKLVLTVAHGEACWAAQRFAQRHQLPLATIFHDWWPDIPMVHQPMRRLLNQRFQKLYQASDLALCVSEGMRQALGEHRNSSVLYPIPENPQTNPINDSAKAKRDDSTLRLLYFGGLYDYGQMVGQFLQVVKDHPYLKVQVRGANPNWSADFKAEMRDCGLWLDFAPRSEFVNWLESADAILVTMSFDPALRRRMETSFPSKLTEASQFGKPIVIWGPDYCSAVKWARKGDRAMCVTDKHPDALVSALEAISQSQEQLDFYAEQAEAASQTCFNPLSLQQQFINALQSLLDKQ